MTPAMLHLLIEEENPPRVSTSNEGTVADLLAFSTGRLMGG